MTTGGKTWKLKTKIETVLNIKIRVLVYMWTLLVILHMTSYNFL